MVTRLTSHEMLQLIARLRGLPSTAIEEEVSFIEGKVGLRNVRDERVDKLRPCDKRKLSVGLALVGSPKLVILNECTREIDPMSRGRLFRCIEKMHSCAQTSMVFASHCLRECDSFCDRVAVLESGEFQVIGETSLLKEGCKQRFTVTVRLTKDKVQEGDYIKTVNRVMKEQFPSSLISDIRMDMLQYTVKDTAIPWSDVFVRMEKINDELQLRRTTWSKACPTIQTLKINSVQNGNNVTVAQALEAFHKIKLRILSVTATAAPDGLVSRSGLTPGSGRLESWNASTGNNSS
ncbi:glucosylceramide transporter ABCA12 [Dermacentor silvarum]|uniref:glucosylceramide transporter ABCA12 n=1 Tax=Dermacentor silvarum TaxID=543639 RepID=UPI00189983A9|nr:glucosylceramide transporter ABCA12 [Dermacentor silvarum]